MAKLIRAKSFSQPSSSQVHFPLNNEELKSFVIEANEYLSTSIEAYYRTDYVGYKKPSNPDYINTLKNTYNSTSDYELKQAMLALNHNLYNEMKEILNKFPIGEEVAVCIVPRAKAESFYTHRQVLFREVIKKRIIDLIEKKETNVQVTDGSNYIIRHTNTRTTHLKREQPNYDNSGSDPYKGIAYDTCLFSGNIYGRYILLIDDVYTKTVNIDEDFIQTLLNMGCKGIIFFAIARTKRKNRETIDILPDIF